MSMMNTFRLMGLQRKGNPRGIYYHDIKQGSGGWHRMRLGRITASRLKRAMGNESIIDSVVDDLVADKVYGMKNIKQGRVTQAMRDGIVREPLVRQAYARECNMTVVECGFIINREHPLLGYSPDGVVEGGKGLLEIKCPTASTMKRYMEDNERAYQDYFWQLNGGMLVADAEFIDLAVWHPEYSMFVLRISRNRDIDTDIEARVATIQTRLDARMKRLAA